MKPKQLRSWFIKLGNENRIFVASVGILALGGVPMLFYALYIGQLPDFTLTDLTGNLIATFITEVVVSVSLGGYFLFAGFFARHVVSMFYPLASPWSKNDATKVVEQTAQTETVEYLFKGKFIVGATLLSLTVWASVFLYLVTKDHPGASPSTLSWMMLLLGLACTVFLTLVDWRIFPLPRMKYAVMVVLLSSVAIWGLMLVDWPAVYVAANSPAKATQRTSMPPAAGVDWVAAIVHGLFTASNGYKLAVAFLIFMALSILALWFRQIGTWLKILTTRRQLRLVLTKIATTTTFGLFIILPAIFILMTSINAAPAENILAAIVACVLIPMLNWMIFSANDLKMRFVTFICTIFICLVYVPMVTNNPILYAKVLVSKLGFANLHATSVTLSSQQCATLRPYGVDCEAKKDESITIANVNILNRIGNTVLLEVLVHHADQCVSEVGPLRDLDKADVHAAVQLRQLSVCDSFLQTSLAKIACDLPLMQQDDARPYTGKNQLTCVRLSVPKDQLVGFASDGQRRYDGRFSEFVDAVKRPERSPAKLQTRKMSSKATQDSRCRAGVNTGSRDGHLRGM
ncbi:hypothetical protein [Paraburkholderia youngii]|uniref:hypothetical protein n=1 Tax=Paraburkholderia youngii TaxID=2782701 RepID=UPI003D1D6211